jgi:hypothetical protein
MSEAITVGVSMAIGVADCESEVHSGQKFVYESKDSFCVP